MRLVCPNCDAEYEVGDDAIPDAGRDVQCSNCGHAWFQLSPRLEAEDEAESAVFDPPPGFGLPAPPPEPPAGALRDTTRPVMSQSLSDAAEALPGGALPDQVEDAEPPAAPTTSDLTIPGLPRGPDPDMSRADDPDADGLEPDELGPMPASGPPHAPRTIDDSVLAVLREEAERETAARRMDAAPRMETQTEMPLSPPQDVVAGPELRGAARHIARMKGLDPDASETNVSTEAQPTAEARMPDPQRPAARRNLLPDIEEINSTLRASNGRNDAGRGVQGREMPAGAARTAPREGFRSGFVLTLLVAVLLAVSYAVAPRLAVQFPQASEALGGYVAAVDAARLWLDGAMRSAVGMLEG